MYIKKLELLNFQVIKEFNADFEGNVYFITGDNELGKSTLLKAIGALLTGNRDAVLKNGEEKGFAKMVVGDDGENYEVELRFTKANPRGTLSIKQETTGMKSDNVSMLQKIFGYQDFDAVEFSRWSETAEGRRKQVQYVKALLPGDVQKRIAEIDADMEATKEVRKTHNAEVKTYTSIADNSEKELRGMLAIQKENGKSANPKDYAAPIQINDLLEEQNTNAQLIEKAKTVRQTRQQRVEQLAAIPGRLEKAETDYKTEIEAIDKADTDAQTEYDRIVKEAKDKLEATKKANKEKRTTADETKKATIKTINDEKADFEKRKANADEWLKEYEKNNPENLDTAARLKEAEEHNKINAKVVDVTAKKQQKETAEKKVQAQETKLSNLIKERETLIAKSELPIAGLTFTDEGLELNGVPFIAGKVSDSQIMEVAAKLIIASNPTVKVFRIARGESLGQKRLEAIIDIAQKNGFQGFIEQVQRGQTEMQIEEYSEPE